MKQAKFTKHFNKRDSFCTWCNIIAKDFKINKLLYLMILPVIGYYVIFHYIPMYGITIAFKDFSPALGILKSDWVGFEHFKDFFGSKYFVRILTNTLRISVTTLLVGFPMPIIFALLLNEIRSKKFTKAVQTITYMPYFISVVVICGIIRDFVSRDGLIVNLLGNFGFEKIDLLTVPEYFSPIYVLSGVWQTMGFSAVIYIAALSGIDQELYEAATIDGANRWKQMLHITLPGLSATIIILLILNLGSIMNVGYEKILLLYNDLTMSRADVISTYVYRKGLLEFNFGYSGAVGLFNSVINIILLVTTNTISKKVNETSLW